MSVRTGAERPVPSFVPAWAAPLHRRVAGAVERLPALPPSFLAAQVLNRVLLAKLPADACTALQGRVVELQVSDFGLRVRLQLGPGGFAPARDGAEPAVRIVAPSSSHLRLLRGDDDPDQLFFERALVIEGDTELGLVLKNTLDAIGPLWPRPAPASRTTARAAAR